jgi:hypothetical protein
VVGRRFDFNVIRGGFGKTRAPATAAIIGVQGSKSTVAATAATAVIAAAAAAATPFFNSKRVASLTIAAEAATAEAAGFAPALLIRTSSSASATPCLSAAPTRELAVVV